jgi:DNA-binding transcriptional ArsR family regulator
VSSGSKSLSNSKRLEDYDAVFAAMDSPVRRQILMILHFRGDHMTSGQIAQRFSCTWPSTSRHLRKLEASGLVTVERAGREWVYRLNRDRLKVATEWLAWFSRRRVDDTDAEAPVGPSKSNRPKRARGAAR